MTSVDLRESISKPEIQFWIPLIVSAVSVTMLASAILSKQAVLETKLDNILTLLQDHKREQEMYETAQGKKDDNIILNLNDLNKRTTVVEAVLKIK